MAGLRGANWSQVFIALLITLHVSLNNEVILNQHPWDKVHFTPDMRFPALSDSVPPGQAKFQAGS
jgi:membrane-associated PAP2 superfamily phosphatase